MKPWQVAVSMLAVSATGVPTLGPIHATRLGLLTSTSQAGWFFDVASATKVTAEFKMPTVKCTAGTTGMVPGTFLITGSALSTKLNGAYVRIECAGSSETATPGVTVDTSPKFGQAGSVKPGDLLQSTVTNSKSQTVATLKDLTKGHTFTLTASGAGGTAQQELVIDNALQSTTGTQLPVVKFGSVTFSDASVDGKALGSIGAAESEDMETSTGVVQIATGALTGTLKNGFVTNWKHA